MEVKESQEVLMSPSSGCVFNLSVSLLSPTSASLPLVACAADVPWGCCHRRCCQGAGSWALGVLPPVLGWKCREMGLEETGPSPGLWSVLENGCPNSALAAGISALCCVSWPEGSFSSHVPSGRRVCLQKKLVSGSLPIFPSFLKQQIALCAFCPPECFA